MKTYDPETVPDPAEWLGLDESERVILVASFHRRAKIQMPDPQIHAAIHSVVENQLAEELQTVRETLERLRAEGLSRHDAIHAVGSVLVEHLNRLIRDKAGSADAVESYFQELRALTAKAWLNSGN
jgi:sirohydrochlorin ferrochelatase